ncbi:MAG: RNA polymerase sigma factor [Paucibacter sp.]|nr:RNA polymerase sigma factor [Roseateles sp.]
MDSRSGRDDTLGLMARLRQGDAQALEPLYRNESGAVYRYALALCANPAWAADAMQEAFVALAASPETFDPLRGSLGGWLAGVARHHLLSRWREARREVQDEEAQDGAQTVAAPLADTPETRLIESQDQTAVWQAIQALPWPFREALVLVDLQERAYVEAARIAGIEINTLRSRLYRARQKLAQALQPMATLSRQGSAA